MPLKLHLPRFCHALKLIQPTQKRRLNAINMKKVPYSFARTFYALLIPALLLLNSCSKQSEPDPRQQYVGSWNLTKINGDKPSSKEVIKITSSTSSTKTMSIADWYWSDDDLEATINGTGFDIADYTSKNVGFSNGSKADVTWSAGVGKLKNDQLVMTGTYNIKYTNGKKESDTWEEIYAKQ